MPTSRRLAMLSAIESHKTPRTRVNGLESCVEVIGMGDEDVVEMVVTRRDGDFQRIKLHEGITSLSLSEDSIAYCFSKVAGQGTKPTTIEMVLESA